MRLKVLFGALGYTYRKWDIPMSDCTFDYEVLQSKQIPYYNFEKITFTHSGLYPVVAKENPLVIITNAFSLATIKLWCRSWFVSTPYIIWSGAIRGNKRESSSLRNLQRKILTKRAAGFVAYGTRAKEYLVSLGADPNKIEIGINTVDIDFFINETKTLRSITTLSKNKKHLLYIGHLTKGKRIDQLLLSIKILSKKRGDFVVQLVGDGPEMEHLKMLSKQLNIEEFVRFEGFKQKPEIPKYLSSADCFLFPSEYDVWGLVLVEAMAAGVPCIASIHAGATFDLIKDEMNGFVMDFSATEKVAERINWILDNPEKSKEIGRNASSFIEENVSLQKSAEGFMRAIERTLEKMAFS